MIQDKTPEEEIKKTLNLFPEVAWDRYIEDTNGAIFYGWIDRDDGKKDFLLLDFGEQGIRYLTSSKLMSKEIARRMGGEETNECQRVESLPWADEVNCIRILKKGENP